MHAIPASDIQEYQGMPMFKEVGPLTMDPAVATQVSHYSQQNPVIFPRIVLDYAQHPQFTQSRQK